MLSGPAAGAVGAAHAGRLSGHDDVLSFDMGGTSCDVAVIDGGAVRAGVGAVVAGRPLQLPMVDVHTVGAGGGSIGWADAGGALRVGPRSAGAEPGPACYGRGGDGADGHRREPGARLPRRRGAAGGRSAARRATAAERAVRRLAEQLGIDVEETARGIVRVADAEMLRALRVVTVERGVDPRRYALVAFGGAGPDARRAPGAGAGDPARRCARAPQACSRRSASAIASRRRDTARTVLMSEADVEAGRAAAVVAALAGDAVAGLDDAHVDVIWDVCATRARRSSCRCEAPAAATVAQLRELFEHAHAERYGYADPEGELEIVNLRVTATAARGGSAVPAAGGARGAAPRLARRRLRRAAGSRRRC